MVAGSNPARGSTSCVGLECEHKFTEFKTELDNFHLGLTTENIRQMAKTHFQQVDVYKIQGIECISSGRSAEMFIATMQKKRQIA